MRALLIAAGVYLLARFQWLVYPFAAVLVYAAVRTLRGESRERLWVETTCSLCSSWISRFIPIATERIGLALLLLFVGAKLALSPFVHIPSGVSLAVIAAILAAAAAASRLLPQKVWK